jgi:hypothetical protein
MWELDAPDQADGLDLEKVALPFCQVEKLLGSEVEIGTGPRLVWIWNGRRKQWPIKDRVVVGRGKRADVMVPHLVFSRRHFEILITARGAAFFDLGSCNGTKINDAPTNTCMLTPGDLIDVCGVIFLYIE